MSASEGYEVIMVAVDRFTKYAHFVPLRHPFTAATVARAFWDNIIKLHGVLHYIVSDRDRIYTSNKWCASSTPPAPSSTTQRCITRRRMAKASARTSVSRCTCVVSSTTHPSNGASGCRQRSFGTIQLTILR